MKSSFKAVPQGADRNRARRRMKESSSVPESEKASRVIPALGENKHRLLDALAQVSKTYGLKPSSIQFLRTLVGFIPADKLFEPDQAVVYASNKAISARMNGISESTVKRHVARLVAAGLLLRKPSPNGKRYAKRDRTGKVIAAFGLDLMPLLAAVPQIVGRHEMMQSAEAEMQQLVAENDRLDLRIGRAICLALQHRCEGNWVAFGEQLDVIRLKNVRPRQRDGDLRARHAVLCSLWKDVDNAIKALKVRGNGVEIERHLQNPNTETYLYEMEAHERELNGELGPDIKPNLLPARRARRRSLEADVSLDTALAICPEIIPYGASAPQDWRQFYAAADCVRRMFRIPDKLWEEAVGELGLANAAVAIAAILQMGAAVHSPGGYFRGVVRNAKRKGFSAAYLLKGISG